MYRGQLRKRELYLLRFFLTPCVTRENARNDPMIFNGRREKGDSAKYSHGNELRSIHAYNIYTIILT